MHWPRARRPATTDICNDGVYENPVCVTVVRYNLQAVAPKLRLGNINPPPP